MERVARAGAGAVMRWCWKGYAGEERGEDCVLGSAPQGAMHVLLVAYCW